MLAAGTYKGQATHYKLFTAKTGSPGVECAVEIQGEVYICRRYFTPKAAEATKVQLEQMGCPLSKLLSSGEVFVEDAPVCDFEVAHEEYKGETRAVVKGVKFSVQAIDAEARTALAAQLGITLDEEPPF
jgi:hypothetical protein